LWIGFRPPIPRKRGRQKGGTLRLCYNNFDLPSGAPACGGWGAHNLSMSTRVTILHTNDFHHHLTPAPAEFLKRRTAELGPDTLLLDSGDAISAGNIGVRPGGEPILTLMSDTGYDAMTMGNREFHVADAILRHKIGSARFPILCANIRYKDGDADDATLPLSPFMVQTLPGGARVGVVGVTVPMVTERMAARHLSAFLFDPPIPVVQRIAQELRPDVDLLIALTHIGMTADEQLAQSCPELDLVVTGHTHLVVRHGDKSGGVPIVQAGWFGHHYGEIAFDLTPGERPRIIESAIHELRESAA
jgi:2',3'-cyclic-nucleotide 2'-phosphodiesterase (5'-nucleotidase family)